MMPYNEKKIKHGAIVAVCAVAIASSAEVQVAYDPSGRVDTSPSASSGMLIGTFDSHSIGEASGTLSSLDSRAAVFVISRGSNVNAHRPGAQIIFR